MYCKEPAITISLPHQSSDYENSVENHYCRRLVAVRCGALADPPHICCQHCRSFAARFGVAEHQPENECGAKADPFVVRSAVDYLAAAGLAFDLAGYGPLIRSAHLICTFTCPAGSSH